MKQVYLDHASTTPVDPKVVDAMLPFYTKKFGNASSLHYYGREARDALDQARKQTADLIGAKPQEVIFTSGGTESDNIAIQGLAYQNKKKRKEKGPHILTSAIEHPAVLETCKHLELQGYKVTYLPVDKYGSIILENLEDAISKHTFLISIMYGNNEIGTLQDITEIGRIAHENNIVFHTDAVQAVGKHPIDVQKMHIDLLSLSSHKMYGPKGVGGLYIRNGVKLKPLVHGGGHENGLRSSTENIPGIVGFATACHLAQKRMDKDAKHIVQLRDSLIKEILKIDETYLNGHPTKRLINNAHVRFTGVEGESLLLSLDEKGIAASTGSACSSKKLQPSHVLLATGLEPLEAHGSLRLSLGRTTTKEDIAFVSEVLPDIITRLRKMSPLWASS